MRKLALLLAVLLLAACTYPTYTAAAEPEVKTEEPAPEPEPVAEPEPAPIPEPYSLYIADNLGGIVIYNDCTTWAEGGWPSRDAYYSDKLALYTLDCASGTWGDNRPWHVVAGYHYEEPGL